MSRIVEFFVAPDEAAAASVLAGGPEGTFETATSGSFLVEVSVLEWEQLTTGASYEALAAAGEPRFVAEDAGSWVFVVSERLLRELAGLDDQHLDQLAEGWRRMRGEEGEVLADEPARGILTDVAHLARVASERRHGLYCWVA